MEAFLKCRDRDVVPGFNTDHERSVSNGGADANQQKDAREAKEVDAEPEESNGLESTLKKSPACENSPHPHITPYIITKTPAFYRLASEFYQKCFKIRLEM